MAETMLIESATAADDMARLHGDPATRLSSLLDVLELSDADGEGDVDAEVIVLDEYRPDEFFRSMVTADDVAAFNELIGKPTP